MAPFKSIPAERREALVARAELSPFADRSIVYPSWYLQRWHFLPDGYLSRTSVRAYDRFIRPLYHALVEPRSHAALAALLRRIGPRSLVEVGCGPGRALAHLARELPAVALVGVDLSPYMLELAAERLQGGADLRHAGATDLPLPAGRTDVVVALHVLGHMPPDESARALDEALRVLRPGGWLITVEHGWHRIPFPEGFRDVNVRRAGLGFARLRVHRKHATAGEALALRQESTADGGREGAR